MKLVENLVVSGLNEVREMEKGVYVKLVRISSALDLLDRPWKQKDNLELIFQTE